MGQIEIRAIKFQPARSCAWGLSVALVGAVLLATPATSATVSADGDFVPEAVAVLVADGGGSTTVASPGRGGIVNGAKASGEDKQAVREFVEDEMRRGRLLGDEQVTVVSGRQKDGSGTVRVALEGDFKHLEVVREAPSADNGYSEGVGLLVVQDSTKQAHVESIGLASDAAVSTTGMTKQGGGCRTVWFDNLHSGTDHKIVTCYEKFKHSGGREWVYNRWVLADQAPGYRISELTIRSRPWSGTEGRIDTTDNWIPKPSASCNNGATLEVGYSGAKVSVPLVYCTSSINILVDSTENSMGVRWTGNTAAQLQTDFAIAVRAYNSSQVVSYADYVWQSAYYCAAQCWPDENDRYADSGW